MKEEMGNKYINILLLITVFLILFKVFFYFYIFKIVHPPDYGYHSVMTILFKENPFSLFILSLEKLDYVCFNHSIGRLNSVTSTPNFYGFITGKLLYLTSLVIADQNMSLRVVSLVQTIFGLLNIFYIYKISKLIFKEKFPRVITILLVSNIQMFSYLINYLSYDNLVNLASTISIYYLIDYIEGRRISSLLILIIWSCVGFLTKISFAPLFMFMFLVFVFFEIKKRDKSNLLSSFKNFCLEKKNFLLILTTIIFISLSGFLYVNKIVRYGTVFSSKQQAKVESDYCRDLKGAEVLDSEFGQNEEDPSNFKKENERFERIDIFSYSLLWGRLMVERSVNVASHKSLYKSTIFTQVFSFLILISSIFFFVRYRYRKNWKVNILFFLCLTYLMTLFLYRYYRPDFETFQLESVIAGRYMFPILGPFIILFVYSFWNMFKKKIIPIIILLLISIFFIYSDKVYLLNNYHVWSAAYKANVSEVLKPISINEYSPKQVFLIEEDYSNIKIGVYISTFHKQIKGGYRFNLFEKDCITLIERIDIDKILDNNYIIVGFSQKLEYNNFYCFNIENTGNENPIVLWYSKEDLLGHIVGDEERDIMYSPVLEYEF